MRSVRVTNMIKETKFELIWGNLEAKIYFQREPFLKYLRLAERKKFVKKSKSMKILLAFRQRMPQIWIFWTAVV